ncbi:30S ribosomal protein S4e [Halocatena pleomorpha]|uniref:Small ribosomal subunit protein eS4 n=1 Tax=Halocatena pleomorpha TaxID=1785090 RepID=A0A3P3RC78_9EURY|nr:30S ribosomal protein S4e [Halocatena pleomorpha]RRJ30300.1 30S ribosomal protein S4e [Halocatena pleomorpha]
MSKHQKRLSVPKTWPIARKEQQYTVKADAGPHGEEGVPLLIVLRDVLGYADSKKEAMYALDQGSVLVNGTVPSDVRRPVGMFDIISFIERKEYYRVFPDEGGRLALTPIDAADTDGKLGKVANKRHVSGGQIQIGLHDGRTLLTEESSISPNDSIVVGTDDDAILAHFPYEEGALVTAVKGRHAGEIGTIDEISVTPGSSPNGVTVDQDDGGFETVEEYVVVIDENFLDESDGTGTPAEAEVSE